MSAIGTGLKFAVEIIKKGVSIAGPVLTAVCVSDSAKYILNEMRYMGKVGYDDAVKAILDSKLYSSDKQEAISMLKMDESTEYYKAVITVVRSTMYSSDKLEVIQDMNRKDEETQA